MFVGLWVFVFVCCKYDKVLSEFVVCNSDVERVREEDIGMLGSCKFWYGLNMGGGIV